MSESKYFWIKLKTDFFSLTEIEWLLSQKNGSEYVVLYQMLCLMTANSGGEMAAKVGEMLIPYDAAKISRDSKFFDVDTVTVAMRLFRQLGLIYEQKNGVIRISGVEDMVGSETKWAKYKRQERIGQCPKDVQPMSSKSIDIRDKNNTPLISPHRGPARASKKNPEDPRFSRFWSEYPKKVSKSSALKAFARIDPDEGLLQQMLSALKKQKASRQWTKDNGEFIPHPATWLNQERWNDEIGCAHEEEDSLDGYILA